MTRLNNYLDGRIEDMLTEASRSSTEDKMWFNRIAQELSWAKQVSMEEYHDTCVLEEYRRKAGV